jgi:hypothetical protein
MTIPGSIEGPAMAHLPSERRSASQAGKPFSLILLAAVSTS